MDDDGPGGEPRPNVTECPASVRVLAKDGVQSLQGLADHGVGMQGAQRRRPGARLQRQEKSEHFHVLVRGAVARAVVVPVRQPQDVAEISRRLF
jgi:hypothetical protein